MPSTEFLDFQSAQAHDPTQYMGQGNDFGTQYRSGCLEGVQKWHEMTMEFRVDVEMIPMLQDDGMDPTASEMGSFL